MFLLAYLGALLALEEGPGALDWGKNKKSETKV